jgi:hypothetical protein
VRYFGKDGPQCQPTEFNSGSECSRTQHLGRALRHGRVPRIFCLWLGVALASAAVGAGLASLTSLGDSERAVRDPGSAMVIRR